MAKLLKEVWKTFYGSFFETEQEAAEAELHWKTDAAITEAWKAAMEPIIESDKKAREEYDALSPSARSHRFQPQSRASYHQMPPGFQKALIASLQKQGALAPVVLSSSGGQAA